MSSLGGVGDLHLLASKRLPLAQQGTSSLLIALDASTTASLKHGIAFLRSLRTRSRYMPSSHSCLAQLRTFCWVMSRIWSARVSTSYNQRVQHSEKLEDSNIMTVAPSLHQDRYLAQIRGLSRATAGTGLFCTQMAVHVAFGYSAAVIG
jgi:hypothetical protein